VIDCYVFITPPLNFDGAGCRRHHPWPYQSALLIGTGTGSPEVAVEAMTGGAHGFNATSLWVFLLLHFAKNVAGEQRSLSG
jgi:hypothetical protein